MASFIFKCSSWLQAFLLRRGIQVPDQRGLYAYHCTQEEYVDLRSFLCQLGGGDAMLKDKAACACFVLFGSEWYRREYKKSHAWTWEPIFQVLGFYLSPSELSKVIPRGLEDYWKRPIHYYESERRDFLGSLFSEGGLPFQVLREENNRFKQLLECLLKQYDHWHILGVSTPQQVEQQLERAFLPQFFSSRTSVDLIANIVDELVALVKNYQLTQKAEPVEYLNTQHPKWRELFPIPLDNNTGSELLNGLLKTATIENKARRRNTSGWSCRHFWYEERPEVLNVQISMPQEVQLHLTTQPSTTRFELVIVENGLVIAELGPSYSVVNDGVANIRLRQRDIIGKRQDCGAQLSLVAMVGGVFIATRQIEGSAVALGEVPLGFEPVNDCWQLCGQASFNTGGEQLLLILPEGSTLAMTEESSEAILSGMPPAFSLQTIKVQGKAQLQIEGEDFYQIRTGHMAGTGGGLELVGSQLGLSTKPSLTFVGLPHVQWPKSVEQQQDCALYFGGRQLGLCLSQEALGTQYISVRNCNDETLLRRKVGILPADFRVELRSGDKPGQGSIIVYSQRRCLFQVNDDSVLMQQVKFQDRTELKLTAKGFPPVRVSLSITPNLMADPVVIDLPFPNSGWLAFDGSGMRLKRDLCVDELLGSRLYLFGRSDSPARFGIELTLKGNSARNVCYCWTYIATDKPLEISLFNIREQIIDLLSLQSGIDQVVEMRVFGNGQDSNYLIRRYATEMQLNRDRKTLQITNLYDRVNSIPEPVLMLLHDPMCSPIPLYSRNSEGVATGEFELPMAIERDGPWLVLPKAGSAVSFRPLFLSGGWQPMVSRDGIHSLQKAVLVFDHAAPVNAFIPVLDAMAVNPMHSGWQFLHALYERYSYLPLATYEVWKALVGHPPALAMALFKFEMGSKLLDRLEAEFPIFWEFLPIAEIHLATKRFAAFLKEKGVAEAAINALIGRMLSRLGERFPSYGQSVQNFLSGKPMGPDIKMPLIIFQDILYGWYHELIRERSEAQWPEFGAKQLAHWHASRSDSVIAFQSDIDYRNAVLYLPVFAAAVASGNARLTDVFEDGAETIFFLRQVRDFDTKWFNSIYQYCLLNRTVNMNKAGFLYG